MTLSQREKMLVLMQAVKDSPIIPLNKQEDHIMAVAPYLGITVSRDEMKSIARDVSNVLLDLIEVYKSYGWQSQ